MSPLIKEIRHNPLLWLLAFVPVVFIAQKLKPDAHTLLFVLSVLAIIPLAALLTIWIGPVLVPRFSPRKLILAGTNAEGRLSVWRSPIDGARAAELRQFIPKERVSFTCAAISPTDGTISPNSPTEKLPFAVSGTKDGTVYISGSDPEGAKRALAVIDRQAEHMTRLIDDLLDVTRISHGKVELRGGLGDEDATVGERDDGQPHGHGGIDVTARDKPNAMSHGDDRKQHALVGGGRRDVGIEAHRMVRRIDGEHHDEGREGGEDPPLRRIGEVLQVQPRAALA